MTYATHGWSDLLDCSVRIEVKLLDLCRTVLVEVWRELIMVIEEIPLALVVHDAVVVCPAGKSGKVAVAATEDWAEIEVPAPVKAKGMQDLKVELVSGNNVEIDWVSFR